MGAHEIIQAGDSDHVIVRGKVKIIIRPCENRMLWDD